MLLTTPAVNVSLANPLRLVHIHPTKIVLTDVQPIVLAALLVKHAILPRMTVMTTIPAVEELVPIPVQARGILLPNPAEKLAPQQQFAEKLVIIIAK